MKINGHTVNEKATRSRRVMKIRNGGGNESLMFQGNMRVNTHLADRAQKADEPDWFSLDLPELLSARRQVKCRKGEPAFRGVEGRIQQAIDAKISAKVALGTL